MQGLLERARFPLDKRPLQLHNLNLALVALHSAGIHAKVCLVVHITCNVARCTSPVSELVGTMLAMTGQSLQE